MDPLEPETHAIDAFMVSTRQRRLRGAELLRRLTVALAPTDPRDLPAANAELSDEQRPARIMALWRICRVMAQLRGLASPDEMLETATLGLRGDPWNSPYRDPKAPIGDSAIHRTTGNLLRQAMDEGPGMPLLVTAAHDPSTRWRWCQVAGRIIDALSMLGHPEFGEGAWGLDDPDLITTAGIGPLEVMAFEDLFMDDVFDLLLRVGDMNTVKHLRARYHYSPKEANLLLRLVRTRAMEMTSGTVEEKRALQEARLQDYLARARSELDLNGEMRALKELAKVQGLTQTAPEDLGTSFLKVVQMVAEKQESVAGGGARAILPASTAEEILPADIIDGEADDPDALSAFDLEN